MSLLAQRWVIIFLVGRLLPLSMLVSSADNLCKQFGPKSDLTKCLTGTMMVFLIFVEKVNFERNQQMQKACKST